MITLYIWSIKQTMKYTKIMRLLIICLVLFSFDLFATTALDTNEHLYVWAQNGMNVRFGPGTNFKIMDKIAFGEQVEFIGDTQTKTQYSINLNPKVDKSFLKYKDEKYQRIIFDGKWIKIKTVNGVEGFAISQYFMNLKPLTSIKDNSLALEVRSVHTVCNREILLVATEVSSVIKYQYDNNIERIVTKYGVGSEEEIVFPNLSISEVLIILKQDDREVSIIKNDKDEFVLENDNLCTTTIAKVDDKVIYCKKCLK